MRISLPLIPLVLSVLAAIFFLSVHWVTYGTGKGGRRLCIVPKAELTFDTTFVDNETELGLAVQHPWIWSRIAGGHGFCRAY